MKYIKLLLTIFLATDLFAQALPIRNDNASTNLRDLGANLNVGRNFAVDQKGQIMCGGSGATSLGKAEDTAATSGDIGVMDLGVVNNAYAGLADTNLDYVAQARTTSGASHVMFSTDMIPGGSEAKIPYRTEDSAFADTSSVMMAGGVNNRNVTAFNITQGDVVPLGVNDFGAVLVEITQQAQSSSLSPVRLEDAALADGYGVIMSGIQAVSAIAQTVGSSGDITVASTDLGNRLVTTNAPAGEMWQSCGTATASTADVAIKAAVASNRIYTTSITCASSDADNATNINFKDGSTVIAVGGVNQMATTSAGTFTATFTTPLRGTSNTALNFNTAVSTSSVICCAAGYISTI